MPNIIVDPASSNLGDEKYMAISRTDNVAVESPISTPDYCLFNLFNCCKPIKQFIDLTDVSDEFKNDYLTFYFEVRTETDDVVATITNIDTGESQSLDDTVGILRDLGDFSLRPKVWLFTVDWHEVYALYGFGNYKFNFSLEDAARNEYYSEESSCYRLLQYDCELAHNTVRIESQQTGYIFNGFDFQGLSTTNPITNSKYFGVRQQIRFYGRLKPIQYGRESDYITTTGRMEEKVQEKVVPRYELLIYDIDVEIGNKLFLDQLIANQIYVSDYNQSNYDAYRNVLVRVESDDALDWTKLHRRVTGRWTLKSTDEGTINRP